MTTIMLVSDETVRVRNAARIAAPELRELHDLRDSYPRSYGDERFYGEADRILDAALDEASGLVLSSTLPNCVVCDDRGCEFCPKV